MAYDNTYPCPPGNKPHSIIDIKGPASYTQVTANPVAGGQLVSARVFGLASIDVVYAVGRDSTGQYVVNALLFPLNTNLGTPNIRLSWETPAGVQVTGGTSLVNSTVRLYALGTL